MSTSDSDCSIDWLASDEDVCNSPKRSSPQLTEEIPTPSSSAAAASAAAMCCSESSTTCSQCGTQRKRRVLCTDGGQCWAGFVSTVSPVQGSDGVFPQQILHVEAECCPARKRTCGDGSDAQTDTENKLFSQKCLQLQCYVPPLASILRGLRSGRYSERFNSFQESVAMDRIQRIMGVLQNPNMGENFLSIIMKIEEMLQHWFPHIKPKVTQADDGTPDKKRKRRPTSSSPPPSASYCPTQLNWLHPSTTCSLRLPGTTFGNVAPCLDVTQDTTVSSSTDLHPPPPSPHCGPPPFKISSPFLERLLRSKESIINTRSAADGGVAS